MQWVFRERIGTKLRLNDTKRFVHSTSNANIFSTNGGIVRFSAAFFCDLSIFSGDLSDDMAVMIKQSKHSIQFQWLSIKKYSIRFKLTRWLINSPNCFIILLNWLLHPSKSGNEFIFELQFYYRARALAKEKFHTIQKFSLTIYFTNRLMYVFALTHIRERCYLRWRQVNKTVIQISVWNGYCRIGSCRSVSYLGGRFEFVRGK